MRTQPLYEPGQSHLPGFVACRAYSPVAFIWRGTYGPMVPYALALPTNRFTTICEKYKLRGEPDVRSLRHVTFFCMLLYGRKTALPQAQRRCCAAARNSCAKEDHMIESTKRFSSRVENYVKYRPSYPSAIVDELANTCGFTASTVIADIGSGTGLLSELFVQRGYQVFGIEPNADMRAAGDTFLQQYPNFRSIDGTAEATTLADQSVDVITAGQAFHWFNREHARNEFSRILRPNGWVALIWNERREDSTPFLAAYEQLLRTYSEEYVVTNHRNIDAAIIAAFFAPNSYTLFTTPNTQVFDFDGIKGRLLSSSYAPEPGDPRHQPMLDDLAAIFQQYHVAGQVAFEYDTNVYYGQL